MEQEKLTQFRHTLSRRIQLGTAYACLVLVLLALGAFTAQHGWYRGFLTGLLSGIDIVVMIRRTRSAGWRKPAAASTMSVRRSCGSSRPARPCGALWRCFCPQALRPCIFPVQQALR